MKSILLLRRMRLKDDLKLVGIMTIITLIMIGVFSSFDYSVQDVKFAIVDEDDSALSHAVKGALSKIDGYDFQWMTLDQAKASVKDENVSGAFYMKEGFMADALDGRVKVWRLLIQDNMNTMQMNSIFQSSLEGALGDYRLVENLKVYLGLEGPAPQVTEDIEKRLVHEWTHQVPMATEVLSFKDQEVYSSVKQSVIGFSLFFAMFTIIFGISEILVEKEQFTWHRQMIAPISKLGILTGHMSFVFLLGFGQVAAMFVVSKYLFKVTWVGQMSHLILVIAVFVFCVTSLGMFLSNFVKSMGQLSAVSPIIITGTAMLGGCFWPLEIVTSKVILALSLLTPQRWAIEAIKGIVIYGEGLGGQVFNMVVLMGMGLFYLLMGAWFLKRKSI